MRVSGLNAPLFFGIVLMSALLAASPSAVWGQDYPNKPITIYCGYEAGATTDVTARALADGASKLLGVPIVVENKPGGSATLCAGLLASKKGDGYTLGLVDTKVIVARQHLLKIAYKPLEDFTWILQYAHYVSGLCVLSDSPFKTIDEFIAYAKANPGLSYGTPGMYSAGHLSIDVLARCKGLKFKHVPYKGGAPANTALLGKHLDFVGGVGQHIQYVRQGVFRMLVLLGTDKRDPSFPDIPTLNELGCQDFAASGLLLMAPRGLPAPAYEKLAAAFRKVSEGPDFQKLLKILELPYDFKDRSQLERELPKEFELYKIFLKEMRVDKKDL
jgi:tripartite-type tricarboxylate transporter receptor subunit TctC